MRKKTFIAVALLVLLGGCGERGTGAGDGDAAGADGHAHSHSHDDAEAPSFSFGSPGPASAATRTIEIVAKDPYRFAPTDLEVESGETVTFVVTNEGDQEHEFVLGDEAYQEEHGDQMASGEMHHEGNAVTIAPGATEKLTWTFPSEGEVLYGCHVAGHYAGGMVGAISVSA